MLSLQTERLCSLPRYCADAWAYVCLLAGVISRQADLVPQAHLAVGDVDHAPVSQSSQRSSRFHKPAVPRAALGIATILRSKLRMASHYSFASSQQSAGFLCKKTGPGQHRREAPFFARVVQQQRHDVESVASAGANPAASTTFKEPKPQQTGTGLLIRLGEVAATSGSTSF